MIDTDWGERDEQTLLCAPSIQRLSTSAASSHQVEFGLRLGLMAAQADDRCTIFWNATAFRVIETNSAGGLQVATHEQESIALSAQKSA